MRPDLVSNFLCSSTKYISLSQCLRLCITHAVHAVFEMSRNASFVFKGKLLRAIQDWWLTELFYPLNKCSLSDKTFYSKNYTKLIVFMPYLKGFYDFSRNSFRLYEFCDNFTMIWYFIVTQVISSILLLYGSSFGLIDKASDFGSEDCRFESCHGRRKKPF